MQALSPTQTSLSVHLYALLIMTRLLNAPFKSAMLDLQCPSYRIEAREYGRAYYE